MTLDWEEMAEAEPIVEAETGYGMAADSLERIVLLRVQTARRETMYSMSRPYALQLARMLHEAVELGGDDDRLA